jgi:ankyrin repeat protein
LFTLLRDRESDDDILKVLKEQPELVTTFREGGRSALHPAAEHGRVTVATVLLERGAAVNDQVTTGWLGEGDTPLHVAVLKKDVQVVSLLLAHGASPDVKGQWGLTPLDVAKQQEGEQRIADLLEAARASAKSASRPSSR